MRRTMWSLCPFLLVLLVGLCVEIDGLWMLLFLGIQWCCLQSPGGLHLIDSFHFLRVWEMVTGIEHKHKEIDFLALILHFIWLNINLCCHAFVLSLCIHLSHQMQQCYQRCWVCLGSVQVLCPYFVGRHLGLDWVQMLGSRTCSYQMDCWILWDY